MLKTSNLLDLTVPDIAQSLKELARDFSEHAD